MASRHEHEERHFPVQPEQMTPSSSNGRYRNEAYEPRRVEGNLSIH